MAEPFDPNDLPKPHFEAEPVESMRGTVEDVVHARIDDWSDLNLPMKDGCIIKSRLLDLLRQESPDDPIARKLIPVVEKLPDSFTIPYSAISAAERNIMDSIPRDANGMMKPGVNVIEGQAIARALAGMLENNTGCRR